MNSNKNSIPFLRSVKKVIKLTKNVCAERITTTSFREKVFTIFISLGTQTDHIPSIQSKDDIEKVKITLSV